MTSLTATVLRNVQPEFRCRTAPRAPHPTKSELLTQLPNKNASTSNQKSTPDAARQILNSQPQIAYALITLMVTMNAVNFEVFQVRLFISFVKGESPVF